MTHVHIPQKGTAAVEPQSSTSDPEITLVPAPSLTSVSSNHSSALKRVFIGPYPVAIAEPQIKRTRHVLKAVSRKLRDRDTDASSIASSSLPPHAPRTNSVGTGQESLDDSLWHFIKEQARKSDDSRWETELSTGAREELVNRVKSSAWMPNSSLKQKQHTKWIGDTFEVGTDLLGANVIVESHPSSSRPSLSGSHSSSRLSASSRPSMTATSDRANGNGKGKAPDPTSHLPLSSPRSGTSHPTSIITTPSTYTTAASSTSQLNLITQTDSPAQTDSLHPFDDYLSVPKRRTDPNNEDRGGEFQGEGSPTAKSDTPLLSLSSSVPEQDVAGRSKQLASPLANLTNTKLRIRQDAGEAATVPIISNMKAGGLRSALRRTRAVASDRPSDRRRSVNFANMDPLSDGTQAPAPPREVLARSESEGQLDQTSAGAVAASRHARSSETHVMTGMY